MITKSVDAIVIVLVLMMASVTAYSQKTDFMTPDFNSAHSWQQERDNFIDCNDPSYTMDTSTNYGTDIVFKRISGLYPETSTTHWNFEVMCGYDNSSVNNFQIFLIANGNDPYAEGFKGYALGTGFKPNYKAVSLVYYEDGHTKVLWTGNEDVKKNQYLKLNVKLSNNGVWYLWEVPIYSEDKFKFFDASYILSSFTFTKTGAQKFAFRFNDFYQDNDAEWHPSLLDSARIISPSCIRIFNNARLEGAAAASAGNYSLNGRHPSKVDYRFYYTDLFFGEDCLASGVDMRLAASNLKDWRGNPVAPFSQTLYQAGREDIVINEIMVDLSPAPFALPKNKYVELFNASARDIRLEGYTFRINDLEYGLPDIVFPSGRYLILCASDTAFARYGLFANILQESRLTVADRTLFLVNKTGRIVDSVAYSQKLYHDPARKDGGYSMERRDPRNSCSGSENWHASTDLSGGTPGRQNSQYQIYVDTTLPSVLAYEAISPGQFRIDFSEPVSEAQFWLNGHKPESMLLEGSSATVTFSKPMRKGANTLTARATDLCRSVGPGDTISISYQPFAVEKIYAVSSYQLIVSFSTDLAEVSTDNFLLSDGQIPILCEFTSDGRRFLMLSFADDFISNKKYTLSISNLCNAMRESISGREIAFRYHALMPGDLLINEVMYYPRVGEKRYVEIYNNSGSDVFLYGLMLRHLSAGLDVSKTAILQSHSILPDGGYAVAAADTASVMEVYGAAADVMAYCPGLPALNTSKGYVVLLSAEGAVLDSMYYEKSMHSNILQSVRGVALERVSLEEESMDPGNWQSAQAGCGYATPGFRNSVCSDSDSGNEDEPMPGLTAGEEVVMENQLIRPGDMDRTLGISLNIPRREVCVSVSVYDDSGRQRRSVCTQEMVYPGYEISWDARDDHGSLCKAGIYVVLIKAWDPTGWTKNYKLACVVGTGL